MILVKKYYLLLVVRPDNLERINRRNGVKSE